MDLEHNRANWNATIHRSMELSPSSIQLTPDLWFDKAKFALLGATEYILLTAKEVALLTELLRVPRCFLSSALLASRMTRLGAMPMDEHCVEQVIYNIRRKLGETGRSPHILHNRRGIGYGIFPSPIQSKPCDHEHLQDRQDMEQDFTGNLVIENPEPTLNLS